jgi:hypothetical protein
MNAWLYRLGKRKKISARRVDRVVTEHLLAELLSDVAVAKALEAMRAEVEEPIDGRTIARLKKKPDGLTRKAGCLVDLLTEADGSLIEAYRRTISQSCGAIRTAFRRGSFTMGTCVASCLVCERSVSGY